MNADSPATPTTGTEPLSWKSIHATVQALSDLQCALCLVYVTGYLRITPDLGFSTDMGLCISDADIRQAYTKAFKLHKMEIKEDQ